MNIKNFSDYVKLSDNFGKIKAVVTEYFTIYNRSSKIIASNSDQVFSRSESELLMLTSATPTESELTNFYQQI